MNLKIVRSLTICQFEEIIIIIFVNWIFTGFSGFRKEKKHYIALEITFGMFAGIHLRPVSSLAVDVVTWCAAHPSNEHRRLCDVIRAVPQRQLSERIPLLQQNGTVYILIKPRLLKIKIRNIASDLLWFLNEKKIRKKIT